jgi:phage terminase large subunit-like protein
MAGHDPETKCFLYTADENLDPFSLEAIKQANPAYGDFLNAKEVLRQAADAKRMPTAEAEYRNLNLNQRIARETAFVSATIWNQNNAQPRPEDFTSGVIMGLDLSRRVDLTALVYVGKGSDGAFSVGCEFFAPADGVEDRSIGDRVPYDLWAKQGYLTLTPGKTVGYDFVARRMMDLCSTHSVDEIRYDRWGMNELKGHLKIAGAEDLPLVEHGQGYKDMTPALNILEEKLLNGLVRHGGNPILTWCAANAVIEMDPAGGRKFTKKRSTGRIDGMVALAMAMNWAEIEDSGTLDEFLSNAVSF